MPEATVDLKELAQRLADLSAPRTESDVQSDLRDLLLFGGFNLGDHHVRLETHAGNRRRIDVEVGRTVFEVKKDLRVGNTLDEAVNQLAGYVEQRMQAVGERYVGVVTDGSDWHLFHPDVEGGLRHVMEYTLDPAAPNVADLRIWLDGALATSHAIHPSPDEIQSRLGAASTSYALDRQTIAGLYEQSRELPSTRLKRELWARMLTTAFGTKFSDEDELFVEHTYLVLIAELIAHAVVGFDIEDQSLSGQSLVSGELFATSRISGVVERDFFDWVIDTPQGERFVKTLAKRLSRFDWSGVQHDVLKVLYESVIDADTRHDLGEYYTPDWLAYAMVEDAVSDPLEERVLDPACGSGTFLFHAIRRLLEAADAAGVPNSIAIDRVCQSVFGVDVHPVAVTLARVTYLLAIGSERLTAERGPLAVPVYLGDSLQWHTDDNLLAGGGVTIYTSDGAELFARELHFPPRVLADVGRFDHLVDELASKASDRSPGSRVPSLRETFSRYAIHPDDEDAISATFESMCRLYDDGRDHIWGYYIRNLARPHWLSQEGNRVDVLIGNPPWLAYRFMTAEMQRRFKKRSQERGLWVGAQLTTHQDLSAFFVARASELYLRQDGRISFVMPVGVLTRQQYRGFRDADWSAVTRQVLMTFTEPWDLSGIEVTPALFPIPCCVVHGHLGDAASPIGTTAVQWQGELPARNLDWVGASPHISKNAGVPIPDMDQVMSPYRDRYTQGAFVWPRVLLLVEPDDPSPLGDPAGVKRIRSARSNLEKPPWRDLKSLRGSVESQFVRPICLGSSLAPFRLLQLENAIIPWDGEKLLAGEELDRFPGLRSWWDKAQGLWEANRPDYSTDDLIGRIEYKDGTSKQFPIAPIRVVYAASGSNLVAARLVDDRAIVSETTYWAACGSEEESHYLTAILNSQSLLDRIRDLQAQGQFGTRHFHKVVFAAGFPLFDPRDEVHQDIASLGMQAEAVAEGLDVEGVRFQKARRVATDALAAAGLRDELDVRVKEVLA